MARATGYSLGGNHPTTRRATPIGSVAERIPIIPPHLETVCAVGVGEDWPSTPDGEFAIIGTRRETDLIWTAPTIAVVRRNPVVHVGIKTSCYYWRDIREAQEVDRLSLCLQFFTRPVAVVYRNPGRPEPYRSCFYRCIFHSFSTLNARIVYGGQRTDTFASSRLLSGLIWPRSRILAGQSTC